MSGVVEIIKKTGLFLFGVVLVIWGYRANAAVNKGEAISAKDGISSMLKALEENLKQQQEAKQAEKDQKKEELLKEKKVSLPIEKKRGEEKVGAQTVIEKEKPEESSGTE